MFTRRIPHRGTRRVTGCAIRPSRWPRSCASWAGDQAVAEVLGLGEFDEKDLYNALGNLCARQEKIEKVLFRQYLERNGAFPSLFLYDVTSSYLEDEHTTLAE